MILALIIAATAAAIFFLGAWFGSAQSGPWHYAAGWADAERHMDDDLEKSLAERAAALADAAPIPIEPRPGCTPH